MRPAAPYLLLPDFSFATSRQIFLPQLLLLKCPCSGTKILFNSATILFLFANLWTQLTWYPAPVLLTSLSGLLAEEGHGDHLLWSGPGGPGNWRPPAVSPWLVPWLSVTGHKTADGQPSLRVIQAAGCTPLTEENQLQEFSNLTIDVY